MKLIEILRDSSILTDRLGNVIPLDADSLGKDICKKVEKELMEMLNIRPLRWDGDGYSRDIDRKKAERRIKAFCGEEIKDENDTGS